MGRCLGCNKKLGLFEGYSANNSEFCKNCFPKRKEILEEVRLKEYKSKKKEEERIKKEDEKRERENKKEEKRKREMAKKKTPIDVYAIIFLLYLALFLTFYGLIGSLSFDYDIELNNAYELHLEQPLEEGYRHSTYEEFNQEYGQEYVNELEKINATNFGLAFISFIFLIVLLNLIHKRKKNFIGWFLVYLWLTFIATFILYSEGYVTIPIVYVKGIFALFFTLYLNFSKDMKSAFYN